MDGSDEGNPRDLAAPDSSPRPEPPAPPLEEPPAAPDPNEEKRLSKQVPIGVLFIAACAVIVVFLVLVAVIGYFALSPRR